MYDVNNDGLAIFNGSPTKVLNGELSLKILLGNRALFSSIPLYATLGYVTIAKRFLGLRVK
jgi:hypothetical protein